MTKQHALEDKYADELATRQRREAELRDVRADNARMLRALAAYADPERWHYCESANTGIAWWEFRVPDDVWNEPWKPAADAITNTH